MITVAIPNSPVFSPSPRVSSSIYCKSTPESLSLTHSQSPSSSFSSPSFKFRYQKSFPPASGLVRDSNDGGPSSSSSPMLSKRKRPAKLAIPVASFSFSGSVAPQVEVMEDGWEEVEADGDGYSVYCKKGKRDAMEDRFKAVVESHGEHKQAFFGVFDGHGGSKAAEFAAENLDKNILNEVEKMGEIGIVEAIKQGYMNTDSQFLKQDHRGGSCCVTAIIRDNNLVVSNAGDCRAVLSSGGFATPLPPTTAPQDQTKSSELNHLVGMSIVAMVFREFSDH